MRKRSAHWALDFESFCLSPGFGRVCERFEPEFVERIQKFEFAVLFGQIGEVFLDFSSDFGWFFDAGTAESEAENLVGEGRFGDCCDVVDGWVVGF